MDSQPAEWIIEHCITGDLMGNRTCVLTTHNVALSMHPASRIVIPSNIKLIIQGSADSIHSSKILQDKPMKFNSNADFQASSSTGPHFTGETPSIVHPVGESTQKGDLQGNETAHIPNVEDIGPVPTLPEPLELELKATGVIQWIDTLRIVFYCV